MRYPDLETDLLRAFVAVAETGSFTAAAEVVARSQSAVSQEVLRLEEIIGRRVFERTSRSLSLTRDGEGLLVAARRMVEFNDALMRQMREPPHAGTLRLGISEGFARGELLKLLARFARLHPGAQMEPMTGLSCELLETYDAGRLDAVRQEGRHGPARPRDLAGAAVVDGRGWIPPGFSRPARLVMLRAPCTYRDTMITALDTVRREWVAVCTASSLRACRPRWRAGWGQRTRPLAGVPGSPPKPRNSQVSSGASLAEDQLCYVAVRLPRTVGPAFPQGALASQARLTLG